jgi:hypothetical protein
MLWALIEGLAGVQDLAACYRHVRLAPRWPAAGLAQAEVQVGYPASGARFGYRWCSAGDEIELAIDAPQTERIDVHLLMPRGCRPCRVTREGPARGGRPLDFTTSAVGGSLYADFRIDAPLDEPVRVQVGPPGTPARV